MCRGRLRALTRRLGGVAAARQLHSSSAAHREAVECRRPLQALQVALGARGALVPAYLFLHTFDATDTLAVSIALGVYYKDAPPLCEICHASLS